MRKYCSAGLIAATALIAALPLTSAAAATVHVLTTKKAGGTAVRPGAVLKASLATGTKAVFATSMGSLTCAKSSTSSKVVSNPARPGKATESLTKQTFSKCAAHISGVGTITATVTAGHLPYKAAVNDAKGNPVTVSGSSKAKPVQITFTANYDGVTFSCTLAAAKITGHASNKGNTVSFAKQQLKFKTGSSICPSSGSFSASYGPVTDSSVKGSPKVFVN
jgi:hypothetical protein